MRFWSDLTDEVIFPDHSADRFLEPYFNKIHIVEVSVDTKSYSPVFPSSETRKPKVVHAPSIKTTKGTEHVIAAVEKLRKMGLDFEYIEVSGVSHQKAIQIYSKADIVVDQLRIGSHGAFACEAMALGKPVICYIPAELLI